MRGWGKSGVGRRLPRAVGAVAVLASAVAARASRRRRAPPAPRRRSPRPARAHGASRPAAINVVFPLISFSSIEGEFEIESDAEYGEQTKAIHLFVNQINDAGGHQRPEDQPDDRELRPDEPGRATGAVQAVDPGQPARVRRPRRARNVGRGQRALRDPRRAHADALPVDDDDQLDGSRLALPVVDGGGRRAHPGGHRAAGGSARAVSDTARRSASWSRTRSATRTRSTPTCLPDLKKIGVDPQVVTVTADVGETATHGLGRHAGRRTAQGGGGPGGNPPAARERVHALHRCRDVAGATFPSSC